MENFAAIDFETANGNPCSVCSVGVAIVKYGVIVEKFYKLIRPVPNYYNPRNVLVHHLTKEDTDSADHFPEVWAEISPKIDGLPLVAHFARFDEGCLKAAFKRWELDYPDYKFHCTCIASRRYFGNRLPNHRLPTVARACGIELKSHHNAIADAEACAMIAMKIL